MGRAGRRRRLTEGQPARLVALTIAVVALAGCGDGDSAPVGEPPSSPPASTAAAPPAGADAEALLASGPGELGDPSTVGPPYFPGTEEFEPAAGPERPADELLAAAQRLTAARGDGLSERAAELFADATVVRRIPEPALRAAVVALVGTVAEPAVEWLTGGRFERVEFGEVEGEAVAQSLTGESGLQKIVVAERLRFEEPGLLSVVLAHEAMHVDAEASDLEELVATAAQALVHMQQLLADPQLAVLRTELAQSVNAWTVIRLNTRAVGYWQLRLVLGDDAPSVLPGGLDRPHFAAFFDPAAPATPGNDYLAAVLPGAGPPGEPPVDPGFDVDTVEYLDAGQALFSPEELVRVADLLGVQLAAN
jgi:hypothetical protein